MTRLTLAAAVALSALVTPAIAQYYGGYDDGYRRAPRGYDYDDDPRPRRRYEPGYDRREPSYDRRSQNPPAQSPRPGRGGAVSPTCATPRGSCQSVPMPVGGGCVCFVPGSGNVPGTVR